MLSSTSGDHKRDLQFRARLWEFLAAPKSGMMLKHHAHAIYSSPMATSLFFCLSCQLRFPSVLRAIAIVRRPFASFRLHPKEANRSFFSRQLVVAVGSDENGLLES